MKHTTGNFSTLSHLIIGFILIRSLGKDSSVLLFGRRHIKDQIELTRPIYTLREVSGRICAVLELQVNPQQEQSLEGSMNTLAEANIFLPKENHILRSMMKYLRKELKIL